MLHYSDPRGAGARRAHGKNIVTLCNELPEHKEIEEHRKAYTKFFEVKDTPARGRHVYYKNNKIKAARKYIGYFALITNWKMDGFTALPL